MSESELPQPSRGLFRRFFRESLRPYWGLQLEIGLCLIVGVCLELVDPLLLKVVIDRAIGDSDRSLLLLIALLLVLALIFRIAFRLLSVWLHSYAGLRILFEFRQRAYEHVQRLSPLRFRGERVGDLMARLTADIDLLQRSAARTVVHAFHDIFMILGILAGLIWLDARLAAWMCAVYPLAVFLLMRWNKAIRRESVRARHAIGGLYDFLEERLNRLRLIQEFRREKREARRHVEVSRPWIASNLTLSILGAWQVSLADMMNTIGFLLVFVLGGQRALEGSLSLGSLVAFYALATRLHRPITGLIDINVELQMARASLARVYEVLDWDPDIDEAPDTPVELQVSASEPFPETSVEVFSGSADGLVSDYPQVQWSYEARGVCLTWPDGSQALQDLNFELPGGQFVGLAGPSGCGKSSLAQLLARYVDPTSGTILLKGQDLPSWRLDALRREVVFVPQDAQVFQDTLAGNLRIARPHATDEELLDVLLAMQLGDFLASAPAGLETRLGAGALGMSGGERQRLALARALLKDGGVFVLDEATSGLDTPTEESVMNELRKRLAGKTVIVIAHRLSNLRHADLVLVLSEGRLVEKGQPQELLVSGGLYARLAADPESWF